MNKIKIVLLIVLAFFSFSACEKDDICVEGDTPLMVIRFYDFEDMDEIKEVPNLRIIGVGQDDDVNTINNRTNLDSINLPLNPETSGVSFVFISASADNEDGQETGNQDTISFNYTVIEKFISRPCGFIANYDNLAAELNTDAENWILDVQIDTTLVENQTSAHVKIFH